MIFYCYLNESERIDTHKNMNRIIRNITTVLVGIVVWTFLSEEMLAQCKNFGSVKGQFSINNTAVQVNGDGGGNTSLSNNIAIKICEGETIKLKSTFPVSSSANVSYWINKESNYSGLTTPPTNVTTKSGGYSGNVGEVELKMTDFNSVSEPLGIPNGAYSGEGKYVITQIQNAVDGSGFSVVNHACQVIEIIKPPKPVASINVCSGSEVQITFPINANNIFDDYEIKFNAVAGTVNPVLKTGKPLSYPFTVKSGTLLPDNQDRIITVRGLTTTGNCDAPIENFGTISINATQLFKPVVSAVSGTTTKGEFKLAVTGQNNISRNLYIRDPLLTSVYDYTVAFKKYGSTATTDTTILQVPDGNKMYCFRAEAIDLCPSSTVNPNLISNEEICTTPATVTPVSNKNVITWLKAPGGLVGSLFSYYQVERLNSDGTRDKLFPAIPTITELQIEDPNVICGQEYTYRILTNYGQKSLSQIIKVRAISNDNPTKIPLIFATVDVDDQNAIQVQGIFRTGTTPTNVSTYQLYRADSRNGIYNLSTSSQLVADGLYKDRTAESEKKSYCYYMTYTNLCNKESEPSDKVCSINLSGTSNLLKWSSETPFSEPIGYYIVYQIDSVTKKPIPLRPTLEDNFKGNFSDKIAKLSEADGQRVFIQVHSEPSNTGLGGGNGRLGTSESNIIKIFRPSIVMSPQIFTPNGDKNNDKFIVVGKFIKNLKMTIYDRWGNAIFYDEQNGYPLQVDQIKPNANIIGWDGTMNNGNKALEGSYAFRIEVEDTVGQITVKEGALLLAY
jgi:gliding motility-associated-like protein